MVIRVMSPLSSLVKGLFPRGSAFASSTRQCELQSPASLSFTLPSASILRGRPGPDTRVSGPRLQRQCPSRFATSKSVYRELLRKCAGRTRRSSNLVPLMSNLKTHPRFTQSICEHSPSRNTDPKTTSARATRLWQRHGGGGGGGAAAAVVEVGKTSPPACGGEEGADKVKN